MSRRTSSIRLLRDATKERQEYEQQMKALKEQMNKSRQNLTELRRKRNEPLGTPETNPSASHGSISSAASAPKLASNGSSGSTIAAGNSNSNSTSSVGAGGGAAGGSSASRGRGRDSTAAAGAPPVNSEVIAALQSFSAKEFVASLAPEPPNVYDRMRPLGAGSFGTVMLVKDVTTNRLYAMKNIVSPEPGSEDVALLEVHILRTLRHPCIVELQAVFLSPDVKLLSLVLSYCESGDLAKAISNAHKTNTPLPEAQIIRWFVQICLAVQCCHEHHIIHRDIKPSNVLLTDNRSMVKLADFGLAKVVKSEKMTVMSEVGTPYYSALEMISNQPYSYPVDVWSLGIMLYEMMRLEVPFPGHDAAEIVRALMKNEPHPLPEHYHPELRNLVWSMLQRDPDVRPKVEQVVCSTPLFRTADNFVATYKPMHVEERSRRAHVRQMTEQLQRIRHAARGQRSRSMFISDKMSAGATAAAGGAAGEPSHSSSSHTLSDEGMDRIDSTSSMDGSTRGGTDGESRCNSARAPRLLQRGDRMDSIDDDCESPEHVQIVDTDGSMDMLVLPNLPRTPSPNRPQQRSRDDVSSSESRKDTQQPVEDPAATITKGNTTESNATETDVADSNATEGNGHSEDNISNEHADSNSNNNDSKKGNKITISVNVDDSNSNHEHSSRQEDPTLRPTLPPPTPTSRSAIKSPRLHSARHLDVQDSLQSSESAPSTDPQIEQPTHSPTSQSDIKTLALPLVHPNRHHHQHDDAVAALTVSSARSSARKSSKHQVELSAHGLSLPLLNTQAMFQEPLKQLPFDHRTDVSPRADAAGFRSARQSKQSPGASPSDSSKRAVFSAR